MLSRIYNDDTFIVSYPKSGTTWFRFILSNYISGCKVSTFFTNEFIPDIHIHESLCESLERPRIMKSHSKFDASYPKVIYLVRDVRDVLISFFFHSLKYNPKYNGFELSEFMDCFNKGELFSGRWDEHVLGWINQFEGEVLVIRYEDLLLNTEKEMLSALSFLNFEINDSLLKDSIESASFSKMQKIEKTENTTDESLKNSNQSLMFVRKGIIGDFNNHLSKQQIQKLNNVYGRTLKQLSYL